MALYTVQAKPRPQYHHRPLLGSIAPTQLPPLGDVVHGSQADQGGEDLDVHEARSYQTGYRLQSTGYRVPVDPQNYPTQASDVDPFVLRSSGVKVILWYCEFCYVIIGDCGYET